MFLKLAWRNIWRNRRRSLITIGSIFFAILFSNLMQSMQYGMWEKALSTVTSLTGHLQVQAKDFWDEQILDNAMEVPPALAEELLQHENVAAITPRMQYGALAAHGKQTKFVGVFGIQPEDEESIIGFEQKLDTGRLLLNDDQGILVGRGLARYFDISIGDTLSLIGMGYQGQSANANFIISGIIKYGTDAMSSSFLVMPYQKAQDHFGAPNMATSLNVYLENPKRLNQTKRALESKTDTAVHRLMTWKEMNPQLVQAFQADTGGNVVFLVILYLIIGFGMFGTIIMMTAERQYEFGVLVGIGMRRTKLVLITTIETIILSLLGVLVGSIGSFPIMYYFNQNPIPLSGTMADTMAEFGFEAVIVGSIDPAIMIYNGLVILLIVALIIVYPAAVIGRLKPVKAMRK